MHGRKDLLQHLELFPTKKIVRYFPSEVVTANPTAEYFEPPHPKEKKKKEFHEPELETS